MNKKIPTVLRTIGVLLVPAALVGPAYLCVANISDARGILIALYLLTIGWVYLFCRWKLARISLLPLSFLISILVPWLIETVSGSGWLQYIGTLLFAFFYALPCTALTLVLALFLLYWKQKKKYTMIPLERTNDSDEER